MSAINQGPLTAIKNFADRITNKVTAPDVQSIIDVVGLEHLKMLLTFQEGASPYYDVINKRVAFESNGTNKRGGPLGRFLDSDNDYLRELPKAEQDGNTEPTYFQKYATKIDISDIHRIAKAGLKLKAEGSPSSAIVKVYIASDDSGKPGDAVINPDGFYNVTKEYQTLGSFYEFARWHGFPIHPSMPVEKDVLSPDEDYWLVMEYEDDTGVDSSNYVKWLYSDDTGGARATWDGTSWTVTADETHCYKLYNDDLCLYGDFSLLVTFKIDDFSLNTPIIQMPSTNDSLSFTLMFVGGKFRTYLKDSEGNLIFDFFGDNSSAGIFSAGWNTICVTYSKEKAEDKVRLYNNAKFVSETSQDNERTFNGYRGAAISPPELYSHPWNFGVYRDRNRETREENNNIQFGAVLLTDTELSLHEVGKVTTSINQFNNGD